MSCIDPFTIPWRSRKASSAWLITSTMAFPMVTTSRLWSLMGTNVVATTGPPDRTPAASRTGAPAQTGRVGSPGPRTEERSPVKDASSDTPVDQYRLPRTVVPIHYDLVLE